MIYAYQKHIDSLRTIEMIFPTASDGMSRDGQELATINGTTYVFISDTAPLPSQPAEITVSPITLDATLTAAIKSASPHIRLIDSRVVDMIRQKYSLTDEIGILRTAPSEEATAYNAYVEECRAWGRGEKAKLGL